MLTTIGRRIKPMNGLGIEYRSAVSSMDATTAALSERDDHGFGKEDELTVICTERRRDSNCKQRSTRSDPAHPGTFFILLIACFVEEIGMGPKLCLISLNV